MKFGLWLATQKGDHPQRGLRQEQRPIEPSLVDLGQDGSQQKAAPWLVGHVEAEPGVMELHFSMELPKMQQAGQVHMTTSVSSSVK